MIVSIVDNRIALIETRFNRQRELCPTFCYRNGTQQGNRLAKSGMVLGGVGCALFYGFLLLLTVGFYYLISQGYIGFILPSGNVPF